MTIHHLDLNRPPIYKNNGTTFYRASSLGSCINELVLFAQGEEGEWKSSYTDRLLEVGNEYEPAIREKVTTDLDLAVVSKSDPVELEVLPGHVVVGNTDGRAENSAGEMGVEIKTLGPDSFKRFVSKGLDPFPEYQWQLSVYMLGLGLPWLYVAAERSREEIDGEYHFYVDTDKVKILPLITEPPIPLSRIRRKVRRITTLAQLPISDLPPCEKAKFCSMVKFHDLIGGNVEAEQGEVVGMDDELYPLLVERQRLKDLEDKYAGERKEIDGKLKNLMEGPAVVPGLGRFVPVLMPGRTTLDQVQLRMDLGEEIEKYEKQSAPYSQLRFYQEKEKE